METTEEMVRLYKVIVIYNLFISMLAVKLFSYFFAKKIYPVSKEIIRWLIIISGTLSILSRIVYVCNAGYTSYSSRATGPYASVYWLLIFFSCVLPFALLFNKFKNNGWAIFLVALLINTGWLMERFVIIVTSLQRDYLPANWSMYSQFTPLVLSLIRGVIIGFFITALSIVVMKYRKTGTNDIKAL